MKNLTYVLVGLVVLLLASCAGFPGPSEETQSLLIIDRELVRDSTETSLYVSYKLVLDNGTEYPIVLNPSDNYLVVEDLPPGRYKVTEMRSRNTSSGGKNTTPLTIGQELILTSGEIAVFPYTFYVGMEKTGNYSYMQRWDLKALTAERRSAMLNEIKEKYPDEAALWEPFKSGNY